MIVSGNGNYGLAEAIKNSFPSSYFASRTTGWNLQHNEDQERFALETLKYKTYISCSAIHDFHQVLLLEKIIRVWKEHNHHGRLVAIGSSADTPVKGTSWIYPIEKKALKAYCRNLSNMCLGGHGNPPTNFRVTYLSVGYLSTVDANEKHPNVEKLDLDYISSVIKWIIDQPLEVNINEMSIDPVQTNYK